MYTCIILSVRDNTGIFDNNVYHYLIVKITHIPIRMYTCTRVYSYMQPSYFSKKIKKKKNSTVE